MKLQYPPQTCSYCKRKIYHMNDRYEVRQPDECLCSMRGEYYEKSGITADYSGISPNEYPDYGQLSYITTKIDQEHY